MNSNYAPFFARYLPLLAIFLAPAANAHDAMPMYHAFRLDMDAGENRDNESIANWDLDGWIGGDDYKLWLKSE